jgi:hypothetical protein
MCSIPILTATFDIESGFVSVFARCDMANEAVTLMFKVGCKRQWIVLALNDEHKPKTGIPHTPMWKHIPN